MLQSLFWQITKWDVSVADKEHVLDQKPEYALKHSSEVYVNLAKKNGLSMHPSRQV